MEKLMIAIVDTKANDIVGPITLLNNEVTAIRMFDDVMKMERSQIGMHPADHELRQIGTFETDTQTIFSDESKTLMTGSQWLAQQESK